VKKPNFYNIISLRTCWKIQCQRGKNEDQYKNFVVNQIVDSTLTIVFGSVNR